MVCHWNLAAAPSSWIGAVRCILSNDNLSSWLSVVRSACLHDECGFRIPSQLTAVFLAIWPLFFLFAILADPRQKGVVAFVMLLDWSQIEIGWLQCEIGWSMTLGECMYLE